MPTRGCPLGSTADFDLNISSEVIPDSANSNEFSGRWIIVTERGKQWSRGQSRRI